MIRPAMTAAQFDALSRLLSLRTGPAKTGASLVLVDGLRGIDAAAQTGASPASISNTVGRVRAGLQLAKTAVGLQLPKN